MNKDQSKLASMLAFLALIVSAAVWTLQIILGFMNVNVNLGIFTTIANIILILVVIWLGWQYAKGLGKVWRIIFIVIAVIAILTAFGVSINFK
ncbi:MAG: hypothetical protein WC123_08060 [Bacilli bacterium]|jgi:hypothetical protein|nr:hypothetical protein [Acholeplasmataceae bacterium]